MTHTDNDYLSELLNCAFCGYTQHAFGGGQVGVQYKHAGKSVLLTGSQIQSSVVIGQ